MKHIACNLQSSQVVYLSHLLANNTTGDNTMKNTTLSTIIIATFTLSAGFAHAQDAEPKVNRIQLNEQIREVVQTSVDDESRIRKTERHQDRITQDKQTGVTDKKMEQHRYKYQERNKSNKTSNYGRGYESRSRSMGASSSRGGASRQGGRR